jgi:hypothetical protein
MAATIVPKFITTLFKKEIERIHKVLLYEISKDYNIPLDELNKKYIPTIDVNNDKIEIVRRRTYNSNLDIEQRCIALNAKQKQCKRSKGSHDSFCIAHMYHQRHGTIKNLNGKADNEEVKEKEKKWEKLY